MIRMIIPLFTFLLLTQPIRAENFSHRALTQVLQEVVHSDGTKSTVHYAQLKADPSTLEKYVAQLASVSKEAFDSWPKNERLRFLINAYNGLTLALIIKQYPVNSIKDIGSFFQTPWQLNFFTLFGAKRNLDYIEHTLIRKEFTEPRIHFALVCAAVSCPPLRNTAYSAQNLSTELEEQTKNFLTDKDRNYFVPETKTLHISKIFSWFKEDFINASSSVAAFVLPYQQQRNIPAAEVQISYLPYDWALNDYVSSNYK